MMFQILLLLSIVNLQIKCQMQQLYENFNSLKIINWNGWQCLNSQPEVFSCNSGMDLIKVDLNQYIPSLLNIQFIFIEQIIYKYQLQLYIDVYGHGSLDTDSNIDNLFIRIDQNQIWQTQITFRPYEQKALGLSHQCTQYTQYNYQKRLTVYQEILHTSQTLKLQLISTVNQEFSNESYLFRNLQIFYHQCYKTCKTCQEEMNKCSSCYDDILLVSNNCQSCQEKINLSFLQISQGCVDQCMDEYDYDQDKVCYKNQKLKTYDHSKLTMSQEGYKVFGPLDTSTILLRITVTIELMDKNFVNVLIDGRQVARISKYRIRSESGSKSNYLRRLNNEIRVEINKPISKDSFSIEIMKYQHLSTIPTIKIQYLVCALNCQICKNNNTCGVCKDNYYLYSGLCFSNCPDYTEQLNQFCVIPNENVSQNEDQQEVFLVKELYDLSTRKERINELFQLVNDRNSKYNFQKGNDIYFSYFQNKRIFGGPFVWVNAQFKFHLQLENIQQIVYVKFEIILGDEIMSRIQFHYQINSQSMKTLTISNNQDLKEDQNWQNDYNSQIIQVREKIEYLNNDNKQLNILFDCDNNFDQANPTFCGIKNLFISVQKPILEDINLLEQNYQNNYQDMEDLDGLFDIQECGDEITSVNEDCDDGNLIPFDGCFNCMYSCEQLCQFCVRGECLLMLELKQSQKLTNFSNDIFLEFQQGQLFNCEIYVQGICLQCKKGFYLNLFNNLCETICGDQIIEGQEECDDGNIDNYDGCSNCQLIQYENCNIQKECAICYYGKCLKCNDGFTLEFDRCVSICGDGLINKLEEECDNPNEQGCNNCQIQKGYICHGQTYSICKTCEKYCKDCQSIDQLYLICHDCMQGFYPVLDKCLQCDNNCITCKIQSNLCTSCYRNDCELCESIPGYYTDYQNKVCITQCGDGIVAYEQENCDDGNLENGDGCDSECRMELSQDFINNLQLWQLNQDGNYNLYLNNSQYKLILNCLDPKIIIDGMQQKDFSYYISSDNNTCNIQFTFYQSIFKYNTIYVTLTASFQLNRLLLEKNTQEIKFTIQPQEQIILIESEKKMAEQIQNAQSTFNLIFLILIPVSIIMNLYDYLWAVLEILSWINNFYFLNVHYPFNVEKFFLISDWSSFVTFPTYQGLNQPNCSYFFYASQKFQDKGIDPLFFNNIQIPFIFIFVTFLLYAVNFLFLYFFRILNQYKKIKPIEIHRKHFSIFNLQAIKKSQHSMVEQQQNEKIVQNNTILTQIINNFIIMDKKLKNKLKQTLSLCLLDITLAIMLQITYSQNNQNIIVGLNSFLAMISINIILFQLYQQYKTLNLHILLAENRQYKEQFEVYYQNINTQQSFGYYFKFFGLIRKILYIYFMVYYYYTPIIQTSLCFFSTSIGVIFILYQNPYNSKKEFYLQLIQEFSLSAILFIAVLFSMNDAHQIMFIQQNKVNLGWAVISFVILAIFFQLFGLTYEMILHFYQIILKIKNYILNFNNNKIEQDSISHNNKDKQNKANLKQIDL